MIVRTAVAVVLAAALLHGQGGATPPRLRFAVNMTTIESAPVFLAAEGPAGAGIVVSGGGIPLLVSGEADTATNAETQALIRSATSPNIRVVLTVAECYYRIVARQSSGIARLSDLKGKRVGTALNTSAHYFLSKMARTAGVAEADVTAVAVPLPDMPAALTRGDVDAIAIWEPQAHNSEQALGADAIVFQDRSVYRELFNLNTTAEVLGDPVRRKALVTAVARVVTASEQVTSARRASGRSCPPRSTCRNRSSRRCGAISGSQAVCRGIARRDDRRGALGRRHSEARGPSASGDRSARRSDGSARRGRLASALKQSCGPSGAPALAGLKACTTPRPECCTTLLKTPSYTLAMPRTSSSAGSAAARFSAPQPWGARHRRGRRQGLRPGASGPAEHRLHHG